MKSCQRIILSSNCFGIFIFNWFEQYRRNSQLPVPHRGIKGFVIKFKFSADFFSRLVKLVLSAKERIVNYLMFEFDRDHG